MKPRPQSRKVNSQLSLWKFQPNMELLEDRNAPGNMLSLSSDWILGEMAAAKVQISTDATPTQKKDRSKDADQEAGLFYQQSVGASGSASTVAVTARGRHHHGDASLPSLQTGGHRGAVSDELFSGLGALQATPSQLAKGANSLITLTRGSAGGGSATTTGGSKNDDVQGVEGAVGSDLTAFFSRAGGGGSGGSSGSAPTAPTANGYGSNISELSGAVNQGTPGTGIYLSNGSIDIRTPYLTGQRVGLTQQQIGALTNLQQSLNGLRVNVNEVYGTPSSLMNTGGYLTSPSTLNPRDVLQQFIYANKAALGLTNTDVQGIAPLGMYTNTVGTPITYVYLQQEYNGIPVFQGQVKGTVTPDGRLVYLGNNFVTDLAGSVNTTTPVINQAQAIWAAAANMGLDATQLALVDNTGGPTQAQTYMSPAISRDEIPIKLMYLPIQKGEARLVWNTTLNSPERDDAWFEINVDAVTGHVWYRFNYVQNDTYRVWGANRTDPEDGSPQVFTDPADPLANGFPNLTVVSWHNNNLEPQPDVFSPSGNNVLAYEDRDGDDNGFGRRPAPNADPDNDGQIEGNDYDYRFDPSRDPYEPAGPLMPAFSGNMFAAIVQGFYWANIFHDVTYHGGFTEAAGNFQIVNFGRGGREGDPVLLETQDDHDNGTVDNANFATPPDGFPGRAQMFVFDFTTPNRESTMDATILFHEFGHGWSTRLNAGPGTVTGLGGIQGGGMGEGWGDWIATFLTQKPNQNRGTPRGNGTYSVEFPGNLGTGRRVLYDSTIGTFGRPTTYDNPQTFNDIDTVLTDIVYPLNPPIFPSVNPPDEIHNVGEVWCQTLWDLNWNLIDKYDYDADLLKGTGGNNIALKLVTEGLKITPANPTFLNARDAILAADIALYGGANQLEIWTAFAGRGMGQYANDGGNFNATQVRENFTIPPITSVPPTPATLKPGNGKNDKKYEPNETSDQAASLGTVNGSLLVQNLKIIKNSGQKDRDWFGFRLSQGGSTTVRIAMADNADLNIYVYSVDASGTLNEVGRSAKVRKGGQEAVNFNGQNGVNYLVQVIGQGNSSGNYGMQITNA